MTSRKLARYFAVGLTAYVIEIASLYSLHHWAGLSPLQSVAISFWIGFVIAFGLQKFITFSNHERAPHIIAKQLALYGILAAWNYLFTLGAVKLLASHLSVLIIRSGAIAIITIWNFVIYRRLFENKTS